jgi:hypothetical protein
VVATIVWVRNGPRQLLPGFKCGDNIAPGCLINLVNSGSGGDDRDGGAERTAQLLPQFQVRRHYRTLAAFRSTSLILAVAIVTAGAERTAATAAPLVSSARQYRTLVAFHIPA